MNARILLTAVIATVAASGALAQFNGEATYEHPVASGSTPTRAEVTAEYIGARDAGKLPNGEAGYRVDPSDGGPTTARSSEAVKTEVVQANARGELSAFNGEATYEYPQSSHSTRTRQEVRDETITYMRLQRNGN